MIATAACLCYIEEAKETLKSYPARQDRNLIRLRRCADALQQPAGRVGKPEDIAEMALFLCSEKAGFITGENICIDGGMTKLMIYHGEHGWEFKA